MLSAEARLLDAFLPCYADRDGILEDRPMKLRFEVFPCHQVDVAALLDQLEAAGRVVRYSGNELPRSRKSPDGGVTPSDCAGAPVRLLWLPYFEREQRPHDREAAGCYTPPPALAASCEAGSNNLGAPEANLGAPEANLGAPKVGQGALDLVPDLVPDPGTDSSPVVEIGGAGERTETCLPEAGANLPRADANLGAPKANLGAPCADGAAARVDQAVHEELSKRGIDEPAFRAANGVRGMYERAHLEAIRSGRCKLPKLAGVAQ